ncbi:MAG: hypothetical protein U1A27_06900 [Phycisphaerae bacterium]
MLLGAAVVALAEQPVQPAQDESVKFVFEVRPEVVRGVAHQFRERIAQRYELSPEQAERVEAALTRGLIEAAKSNRALTQALFEASATATLTSAGFWTSDIKTRFGRQAKPHLPAFKTAIGRLAASVRQELSTTQQLRFAADYAAFSVAYTAFEGRVSRWADGRPGEYDSLHWEDKDDTGPTTRPDGTMESRTGYRARNQAAYLVRWNLVEADHDWDDYLENTSRLYEFTPEQRQAADAIVKDCRRRLDALRTPERARELRAAADRAQFIASLAHPTLNSGPLQRQAWGDVDRLRRPAVQLSDEFRNRIDELADSRQRARAVQRLEETMQREGYAPPK